MTVAQLESGRAEVENQYTRAVRRSGNQIAQQRVAEVFEVTDRDWRGIGEIPSSGLRLRDAFREFDAEPRFNLVLSAAEESSECIAGLVLQGLKRPYDCPAFGERCTPDAPLGAPMVSSEGACAAYFHFGRRKENEVSLMSIATTSH
jgi:hydrogenase expression/formation protein HypD